MINKIKSEIPYQIDSIERTDMGLTNVNYIIEILKEKYILRFPKNDVKHLFNPKNEKKVIQAIKNQSYTLPVHYYKDGIQIVKYEPDLKTFENINKSSKIKDVANLMKKFHGSNITVDFDFDPLKQIELYKSQIKNLPIKLEEFSDVFDQIKTHRFKPVLCHNDWVDGNICFINDKTYLIDFEYAGNNDPLFDIMSFLTENDLSNVQRVNFLELMFPDGISDKDYKTLMMYRDINNILWLLWAQMMYEFRLEPIYLEIVEIKYRQLHAEYQKPLWTI